MKPTSVPCGFFSLILRFTPVLLLLVVGPLHAGIHDTGARYYHDFIAEDLDPVSKIIELIPDLIVRSGSDYTLETDQDPSMPLVVTSEKLKNETPSVLVVLDLNHVHDVAWSLSVWMSMLEVQLPAPDYRSVAFSIIRRSAGEAVFRLDAGEPFWLANDPYKRLADMNPRSVILLDILPESLTLSIEAETRGRLSPLYMLTALRSSLTRLGLSHYENPVKALYARAGLIDGSVGLMPWLERGVPAIRLQGWSEGQFLQLPGAMQRSLDTLGEDWESSRDVNYLRYQLPMSVISIDDVDLTRIILILLALFMASVALRPLLTRSHTGHLGPGALPEALLAYLFSFIAVFISWSVHGFGAKLFGVGSLSIYMNTAVLTIGILGRLGSTMLFFFALSGLSARLGLLPHAVRGTASQAAAMIAGVLGVSVLFFSIQGALLLFGIMILLSLAGLNAAVAVLSISVLVITLFPLVFSAATVFIPGLVTILNAQGRQLLLLAGFTAPVALWILTTLSPRHRLVRGDTTAPYLVAVALIICFLDPWLRSLL